MNRILQRINLGRDFSVVCVTDEVIRGVRFHNRGNAWLLKSFANEKIAADAPDTALATVMQKLGSADFCAVAGSIPGALFFRFTSTQMPAAAQRGAVQFELPRRLLRLPEKYELQFATDTQKAADGTLGVNTVVLPQAAVTGVVRKLERARCTADEFIYPFLGVSPQFPSLWLPEIEKDFYFADGKWHPVDGKCQEIKEQTLEKIKHFFKLPETGDFNVAEYLPELVVAALIANGGFHQAPEAFKVLPEKVRPVRYRKHLIVSALLVFLLLVNIGWKFFQTYGSDISEYRNLTGEVRKLKNQTSEAKISLKRASKELKEMSRVVEMSPGKFDAIREFGLISSILPGNVMVSSIRWNESDIDMVLQCENDKLDLPSLFQPLKRWKIAQLQQRQSGDSAVATINLKLAPADIPDKTKKENKR